VSGALQEGTPLLLERAGRTWRTEIVAAGDPLLVALGDLAPADLAGLPAGTALVGRYHTRDGVVRFETAVLGLQRHAGADCLRLAPPERVDRQQRRKHLRVARRLPVQLRLPLRNDALSKAKGRDMQYDCWIEAVAVNIGAGGFRVLLKLPRAHSVAPHRQASVRFTLEDRLFRDKTLRFLRRDWGHDDPLLVYAFAGLDAEETAWIERHNLRWMQPASGAAKPESS